MTSRTERARDLAMEFKLYEYIWPRICGTDRQRWEAAAEYVERAAKLHHKHHCPGTMADGKTRQQVPSFVGDHAERHRMAVTLGFVIYVDAGIPRWVTESPEVDDGPPSSGRNGDDG